MKKTIILSSIFTLFVAILLSGCNKEEPYQSIHPSPRDGVYEGKNLIVTINGEEVKSIKSVRIFSEIIGYAEGTVINDQQPGSNPIYHTSVIFDGFPGTNGIMTLKTVSTLYYFDGKFNLNTSEGVKYYEYSGTFTGDPNSPHIEQGLVLEFNSVKNIN